MTDPLEAPDDEEPWPVLDMAFVLCATLPACAFVTWAALEDLFTIYLVLGRSCP